MNSLIDNFTKIRKSRNLEEVCDLLYQFQPNKLGSKKIIELVNYIEKKYGTDRYSYEHYNSFGTGGDKTTNISSISCLLAANIDKYKITILKTGTKAVTSRWGSREFFSLLNFRIDENKDLKKIKSTRFKYQPLDEFGYNYSKVLVEARKKLYLDNYLDIFKIIMPASNLVNSRRQLNGVYREEYIPYFIDIGRHLKRNMTIVHSIDFGADELLFGDNIIIQLEYGNLSKYIEFSYKSNEITDNYLSHLEEQKQIQSHVDQLIDLLKGKASKEYFYTILLNAASIIQLKYNKLDLEEIIENIESEFQINN